VCSVFNWPIYRPVHGCCNRWTVLLKEYLTGALHVTSVSYVSFKCNCMTTDYWYSLDSKVSVVAALLASNPGNRFSVLNWERDLFLLQNLQTGLRSHPASYVMSIVGCLPGANRPRPEIYYPPSSSTEVKIEWSYLSTPPRVFVACTVLLHRLWLLSNLSLQLKDMISDCITDSGRTRLHYQLVKYMLLLHNYHRHAVPLRFKAFLDLEDPCDLRTKNMYTT